MIVEDRIDEKTEYSVLTGVLRDILARHCKYDVDFVETFIMTNTNQYGSISRVGGANLAHKIINEIDILSIADTKETDNRWKKLEGILQYTPVAYQLESIRYQSEYFSERMECFIELPIIISSGQKDIGLWPICLMKIDGKWNIGSSGAEIVEPLLRSDMVSNRKTLRKYLRKIFELLSCFSENFGIGELRFQQTVYDSGMDMWHRMIMEMGGSIQHVTHDAVLDLSLPEDEWKRNFHKTTIQRIREAEKLYDVSFIDSSNGYDEVKDTMLRFREYHYMVAGRRTRGESTWKRQIDGIMANRDFVIFQYDKVTGELDGATLFTVTHSHCYYSVSAYNREKFDRAIGHQAQYRAIERLKDMGVRYYVVGDRYYADDGVDNKNMNISEFKEAFASHILLKLHMAITAECLRKAYGRS